MQIVHRVSFNSSPDIKRELVRLGHVVPDGGLVSVDVDEADVNWPDVEKWIARRNPVDIVSTRFMPAEKAAALWVELVPSWHRGYPQPEENFAFLGATYDLSGHCNVCGVGAKQNAPFRMRKEPRWGRNDVLQLNWVFDEFFVTPRAYRAVFEPFGVACRPVLDRKGQTLETVVQLAITDHVEIEKHSLRPTACEACGRTKFLPHTRGPFPALTGTPSAPIARTVEEFGSGSHACRRIVASAPVAAALTSMSIRGLELRPVATGSSQSTPP
jgi:hypothetical protein